MNKHRYVGFEDSLDENDYGIIVTPSGRLKGVWIPRGQEENIIPETIVQMCIVNFGIDPNTQEVISQTIH